MVCSTDVSKPDMTHKTGIQVPSPSYPSALIFLELMKKEYEVERDRKKALEVRLGTCLTFSSALLLYSLNTPFLSKLLPLINKTSLSHYESVALHFNSLLILMYIGCLTKSIIDFINAINVRKYSCFDYGKFRHNTNVDKEQFALVAATHYCEITNQARYTNEDKAKKFKTGLYCLLLSILFIVVTKISLFLFGL